MSKVVSNKWGQKFIQHPTRYKLETYQTINSLSKRNNCSYTSMCNQLLEQRLGLVQ